jgi:protocatechuate 3,4-dioxygenase beta subunit
MTLTRSAFVIGGLAALVAAGQALARGRPRADLYDCEGCEAAAERDSATLDRRATLAGPDEPGERMLLRGIVRAADGGAPAPGVVIYAHHTNAEGLYANGSSETVWSRRHGRLRGWVRTGDDGAYAFDTIKPAPYPARSDPAHVHLFVLEPGRPPYWIDDVVFEGELGVDAAYRAASENRGGPGIVALEREDGVWIAERDIVLERHPG